ncbi:MAG: hypothetical protein Q9160_002974 [Pyrenula sp. 1 TL-2023]
MDRMEKPLDQNKKTTPPDDTCGGSPNTKPKKRKKKSGEEDDSPTVEAYSNADEFYSKMVFCNYFFNSMSNYGDMLKNVKRNNRAYQDDLWNYQNRARTVFHEITHLDYFMEAPKKVPHTMDLNIQYNAAGGKVDQVAYGPDHVKILANYEAPGKGGFYTQRNADSFAWFAMAKQIEKEIGRYPPQPANLPQKPSRAPRDEENKIIKGSENVDLNSNADPGGGGDVDPNSIVPEPYDDGHWIPGCPDHVLRLTDMVGEAAVEQPSVDPHFDNKLSTEVPTNVFHGQNGNIYDSFCFNIDPQKPLKWTVDSHGVGGPTPPDHPSRRSATDRDRRRYLAADDRLDERAPPPNPDAWKKYSFQLAWEPDMKYLGCQQNPVSCVNAFRRMADAPSGHQGPQMNVLADNTILDIPNCGAYSYKILPVPNPLPATPSPSPSPQSHIGECPAPYPGVSGALPSTPQNIADWVRDNGCDKFCPNDWPGTCGDSKLCQCKTPKCVATNFNCAKPGG